MTRDATTAMTARQARRRGVWLLAGLALAALSLLLPGAALAEDGPDRFVEGALFVGLVFGLVVLGGWLTAFGGCLWLALRGDAPRRTKTVRCIAVAIAFVGLRLVDRLLFFDLPGPVLQCLKVSVTVLYMALALAGVMLAFAVVALAVAGTGWCLGKIGKRLSARNWKTVAENDRD